MEFDDEQHDSGGVLAPARQRSRPIRPSASAASPFQPRTPLNRRNCHAPYFWLPRLYQKGQDITRSSGLHAILRFPCMIARRTILLWLVASLTSLLLASCHQAGYHSGNKVLIGATTVVALGAQPIEDSVILIGNGRIRMVGSRKDVPIPQDSERTDVTGKWILPSQGGRIAIDEPANLVVLNSNNPSDVSRRMMNGEWQ